MTCGDLKDLTRMTTCLIKHLILLKINGYPCGLASMAYRLFDKKTSATCPLSKTLAKRNKFAGDAIKNEYMSKKELEEELQKPIIRKFNSKKVLSYLIDNIWGTDLAGIQLISNLIKELFFYYVIDIFSKYLRIIPLKDNESITITNALQKNLKESNRVDMGRYR